MARTFHPARACHLSHAAHWHRTERLVNWVTATHQIAAGNQDLSQRTEEQAASLEETASSRVLGRRLTRDLAWQTEAYQQLQTSRQDVLLGITRLAWDADSYTDLIVRVGEILGTHDEVAGCSVGRPDSEGGSAPSPSRA
ncbi:hypothetical protein [Pararobbsia alpina]|nr:hypothetical protein [Pararobbsia alpina]